LPSNRRPVVALLLLLAALQGSLMTLSAPPAVAATPAPAAAPEAPRAPARPHTMTLHGVTLTDPWHWLKDQSYPKVDDPDVLAYLTAENAWFEAWMAPRRARVNALFEELKARIKEDDASVPVRDGDYIYWRAFETGGQYRKWWRRPVAGDPDQLILDEPAEAQGKEYFRLGAMAVSPDGRLLAWSADSDGSERFTLKVRDLDSGRDIETVSTVTLGAPVWSADGRSLAFVEVSEQWRPYKALVHKLGGGAPARTLYEETDPSFFVGIGRTQDRSHLVIHAADHVTSEARVLRLDALSGGRPALVSPRKSGREYHIDADGERFIIRANDTHLNFRVVSAPFDRPGDWSERIAGSDSVYIRGATPFRDWLVLSERVGGLDQVRMIGRDGAEHRIDWPEASYEVGLDENPEFAPAKLRLAYESMVTPPTVYDYDVAARRLETRKVQEIPSGHDPARYEVLRLMAPARDGTLVPVSVLKLRGAPTGKLHLYGYGAYGLAMTPGFSTNRLSLVDRGVAYAIAHIRGGDDLGYAWYLGGKLDKRMNTYTDFVDAGRHLVAQGLAREGEISISGGSAGGNLMGVVLNTDPALWRAAVAHVPFVDMLNTMLDTSLPLTPIEWPEWGDPIKDAAAFRRILSFSPYENVRAQAYPPILVTAGLNDPRVTYWEPAKWVARLRATKTDSNVLLLKTNMGAGHGGKSGRFERLRETAEEYAFLLWAHGIEQ
jgi:oligopeptidase B